ncbi:MAG TPA: glutamine--fructose-6-phosphate transaminase (isomerizing) [Sphingomonadales bacterium]
MCGIIGIVGDSPVAGRILDGLKRLEYRGYDSAGIATLVNGAIERRRAQGKLVNLEEKLRAQPLSGTIGIGHTRWATHGAPTEANAHPHATAKVAIVHNGIIENFRELREELIAKGHVLHSETDTEVIAHLITDCMDAGASPLDAAKAALKRLEGAFALAIIFTGEHDLMVGARRGSPLVLGYGDGEMYLGSDAIALAHLTNRIAYLDEGDVVAISRNAATIWDDAGGETTRPILNVAASAGLIDKGNYRHYMQKEIFEQPTVVAQTLGSFVDPLRRAIRLPDLPFDIKAVDKVTIVACGTSFYAGMVAEYWLEKLARLDVTVDIASEFRYRDAVLKPGGLALFISQSGETADTLAALRHARAQGQHIVSIVNVPQSSMARESDLILPIHAGPEIGVASTKAFTCQLAVLACFAIGAGVARGTLSAEEAAELVDELTDVPSRIATILNHDENIEKLAFEIAKARDVIYLGRGPEYPIALEGALKLKEISYIHAEGYAAGEMKHGPIALIDEGVPIIVLAPSGPLFDKTISNMQEVIARKGSVVLISDADGVKGHGSDAFATIELPKLNAFVTPILYSVPVQLIAYHTAVHKGTDVDQPRNLAKSVTVE